MFSKTGVSLKKQAFSRLLIVSCVAIAIVAAASLWLNKASFQKAKLHARSETSGHIREQLALLSQGWEREVLRTRHRIELTRYLEDRASRWKKLEAYFIAQSDTPQFSHVAVTDSKGFVLFRHGEGSERIPSVLHTPGDQSPKYAQIVDSVYRMFRLPVNLGPDGMGYLILLKSLDNALLVELSYPDTRLYITWNGRATASSLGNEGIEQYPKIAGKSTIDNRYYEEILFPLDGADARKRDIPVLAVRTQVERPFSAMESAVLSMALLAALTLAIWLSIGAWLTRTINRLLVLSNTTGQFSRERKVDPAFEAGLANDAGGKDELGAFGSMTLTMMRTIEEGDKERMHYEKKLKQSNEELEQFAYVASHDLQEPLRKIAGFSELLSLQYKGRLDADADRYLEYIVDGAYRMQTQIKELLEYSRIDRKGKEFSLTDCNEVLINTLQYIHLAIDEAGAAVTHDPLPTVKADGVQLGQVFQNLITNAVKFRGTETPQVHISAELRGKEWVFSVQDNGIGIAPESCERIFVMFQRLHTREDYPGTGLGLAICKKIVERHKGRIWVESVPGKGSTFRFTIPA